MNRHWIQRSFWMVLCLVLVQGAALAKGPLKFKKTAINVGRLDAGTQPKEVIFQFQNKSKSEITITDIRFKNAKMTVHWQQSPIDPKTKNQIRVEWVPNYHWGEIPDQYKQQIPIEVVYTDGKKQYSERLKLSGQIFLNRREVFNRSIGKLNIHRLNAVWNYCLGSYKLRFDVRYANFTNRKQKIEIGLSDKSGKIYQRLIKDKVKPSQERYKKAQVNMQGSPIETHTYIAFYVDGQLQAVEPFEVILWNDADIPTKKAWKRARHYTFDIIDTNYENVYDADDEKWKRLY